MAPTTSNVKKDLLSIRVLSQEFVDELCDMWAAVPQPRPGRKIVARQLTGCFINELLTQDTSIGER